MATDDQPHDSDADAHTTDHARPRAPPDTGAAPPDPSADDAPPGAAPDDDLPVAVESMRTYVHVRPTEASLTPGRVKTHFRRLHQLGRTDETRGLLARLLRRTPTPPTVECLLISEGAASGLTYAFGVDDPDAVDQLERLLRVLFPNAYEFERVTVTEDHLGRLLGAAPVPPVAAVEYCGRAARRNDWQLPLTSFDAFHADTPTPGAGSAAERVPLSAVLETMAASPVPMVYQALIRPLSDWSRRAENREIDIEANHDTIAGQVENVVFGPPESDALPRRDESRLEALETRDPHRSFVVTARVAAVGADDHDPVPVVRELVPAFADVSGTFHEIEGRLATGRAGHTVFRAMRERTLTPPSYERLVTRIPGTANRSRGIVADVSEAPSFCLFGGDTLTAAGARIVGPTPGERTALPRPPVEVLEGYRGEGMVLGRPLTQDGTPDSEPLVLPPSLQPLHVALFGKSGAGKSTALANMMLSNHDVTRGASIFITPKGDTQAVDYLRAHYATRGSLDDVIYFDCAELVPAFSFFDIRRDLEAGISRTTAVEDRVDHYIEILTQIMGQERFDQAVRSPDVIRYLVKAMFDPVSGYDAFSHRDLHTAVRQMHERHAAPTVSDPDLERMLAGVVANRARSFDEIMQGVANRMEKIPVDRRLARVFNHVASDVGSGESNHGWDTNSTQSQDQHTNQSQTSGHGQHSNSTPGEPHFDLGEYLDEDVVIVFDTGELRPEAQRVMTLLILSNLWTALRRRARRGTSRGAGTGTGTEQGTRTDQQGTGTGQQGTGTGQQGTGTGQQGTGTGQQGTGTGTGTTTGPRTDAGRATGPTTGSRRNSHSNSRMQTGSRTHSKPDSSEAGEGHPLVNLYVEEAASIAASDLLTQLLAQSRSFDCSVTLAMQFPSQLRTHGERVYEEVLNNVSTFLTGNVPANRRLAERLATDEMDATAVGNRLRALRRGQWLVRLPAAFDEPEPRPFLVESVDPPAGDPAGPRPLSARQQRAFEGALEDCHETTRREAGLSLAGPSVNTDRPEGTADPGTDEAGTDDAGVSTEEAQPGEAGVSDRVDSALPHTRRMPPTVEYEAAIHALRCRQCNSRYDPDSTGMQRAITCCSSLEAVDRDDIPICDLHLKLTAAEREASEHSDTQLMFLQAVYNAQQLRYDPLEYDLLSDSMLRLAEYVGIDGEAIQALVETGLLSHDTDHPHRLYTVTPEGRDAIGEGYREGVDYGHGAGDLEESSQHVLAVEVGRQYLEGAYVENPDSPVVEVVPYYDLGDGHRLDIAGLDETGEVVVAVEAERVNHDIGRAVPEDFDKMAACGVEEAIWIVMTRQDGHAVLEALNNPLDGDTRVEKTYAASTPPQQFKIDTAGLTAIYPVEWVRDRV